VAAHVPSGEVKSRSIQRRVLLAAVLILLILFVVRPGASRLKNRITLAISRAVARPADIGSVHIRFLPRPGFDLENVVIYEDPAFGAEPMLRAPEVTAVVRLTSLLRGRLDISRLELTEPSLNLVHRADGRWNWESLLQHTAEIPLAPTSKSKSESRPGFPYIESSSGRINLKIGAEKTPFTLLNADFSLWQESDNAWGMRLLAEPVRTDMNLSDTGLLRVDGTWQRAGSLRDTPLRFSVEWQRAQLGQLTKLISGNDKGWRGDVQMEAALSGKPSAMQVAADVSVEGFHRYDISTGDSLKLAAHCRGEYSAGQGVMRAIACSAPVGDGVITLKGSAGRGALHPVDLALEAQRVPVSALAQLARRMKKELPADLLANGTVQGSLAVRKNLKAPSAADFAGHGEINDLRLQSSANNTQITLASIPFTVNSKPAQILPSKNLKQNLTAARTDSSSFKTPEESHVEFGPFPVGLGRPEPARARAWISLSGYAISLRGDSEVSHTLRLATLMGLPALKTTAEGEAQLDLQVAGFWSAEGANNLREFSLPRVNGTVQLHEVRATPAGLNGPLEISTARVRLTDEQVRAENLTMAAAGTIWNGWVELPRGCGTPGACPLRFHLSADEVGWGGLQAWLNLHPSQRHWYQVLSPQQSGPAPLLHKIQASGDIVANRLRIHDVVAEKLSASVAIDRGKVRVSDMRADLFDGKYRGEWRADFSAAVPAYSGSGTLTRVSLEQVAHATHDPWIAGTASGIYEIQGSSGDSGEFWRSAEGAIHFDVRDGSLPHISLNGNSPLQFARWQGEARLRQGKIEIAGGEIVSPSGAYQIAGTASLSRLLDLRLAFSAASGATPVQYNIRGTLAEPQVTQTPHPETQARLKP
jgi:hypothetical protein